jgi:exodeoxyribonuclease V alpha subunit
MSLPEGTKIGIEGIVTSAQSKGNGCTFSVYTVNSKKTFTCHITKYCPVDEGDHISAVAEVVYRPTMRLDLIMRPVVVLPTDEETIAGKLQEAVSHKRYRISSDNAYQIYDHLSMGEGCRGIDRRIVAARLYGEELELELKDWQKRKLVTWWYKHRILRRFHLLGLTNSEIVPYRDEILELHTRIITNPYRIPTIPLDKCQEIIAQYGLDLRDHEMAGKVIRFIYAKMGMGWTATPTSFLYKEFPGCPKIMDQLRQDYEVVTWGGVAYLDYAYRAETFLVDLVKKDRLIQPTETVISSHLTDEQRRAVEMALSHDLCIITGGPGTGKTTLLQELVRLKKVDLASFTGKAVVRMKEVTKKRAYTLHQLLGSSKDRKIDHLVIDEASMVGLNLFYRVVDRFKPKQITLIGDRDQLEPIEWGNMFSGLVQSGKVPTIKLTKNHRSERGIVNNLLLISSCDGIEDEVPELQQYDDFTVMDGGLDMVEAILTLAKESGLKVDQFKVITPYNKDIAAINSLCQAMFNPEESHYRLRVGDPVMMTENRYDIGVMNGQEGIVTKVNPNSIIVSFDKEIEFPFQSFDDELNADLVELSYAITVHRSQGSEWEMVIFYIPSDAKDGFINRRLVYTALSRAKKQAYYIGDTDNGRRGLLQGSGYRCSKLYDRLMV